MRYALIIAGGSGTRLWPMSRNAQPKQLIPFVNGKSLLQIAYQRLEGLVDSDRRYICAGNVHRDIIIERLEGFDEKHFLGEPVGRDTLNALAYSSAVIKQLDPDAVIAVFTADHIIEPVEDFRRIVAEGFETAENNENCLVTFGITPEYAATGFGYLELEEPIGGNAKRLKKFREKPDSIKAEEYFRAGSDKFLWNSGMFIWRADTLLNCVKKYEPDTWREIQKIAESLGTDSFAQTLEAVYPGLKKISIDFAVMEPASEDPEFTVAAVPMPLSWIDIGSWTAYSEVCEHDDNSNSFGDGTHLLLDSKNTIVTSEERGHLVAGIGLEDIIVVHTPEATLICPKERDQDIKKLYNAVKEKYGDKYV